MNKPLSNIIDNKARANSEPLFNNIKSYLNELYKVLNKYPKNDEERIVNPYLLHGSGEKESILVNKYPYLRTIKDTFES